MAILDRIELCYVLFRIRTQQGKVITALTHTQRSCPKRFASFFDPISKEE